MIYFSDGSSHSFSSELGCWLQLVAARNTISNLKLPAVTASLASHPLAQLSAASTGLNIKLDEKVEVATMTSNIEAKLSSSLYLGSGPEYRYLTPVHELAEDIQRARP